MPKTAAKKQPSTHNSTHTSSLPKLPTGISGLDQVTGGGLPKGRTTLICGSAGSGKTLLAMEFLMRGIIQHDEGGVCLAFEETSNELAANFASMGYDIPRFIKRGKLFIDYVEVDRRQIIEAGDFDLDPILIRLDSAIRATNAKRVVLDTLEVLFTGFQNQAIIRAELRRMFHWLKERGVTAVVTGEAGIETLTRHGLEEYVADCVIFLDHRVNEQVSTRRLRIVKYRGSAHGTNEYPFLVNADGVSVVPITALGLDHRATMDRISSGIAGLDEMMKGSGFFRASSILITGTAGTGKSSFASYFADAACSRGERALYLAFEESPQQIMRNMSSVALNLKQWVDKGLLVIHAVRPTSMGLESHLAVLHRQIEEFKPQVVVMDPITNLISVGEKGNVKAMLTRVIDFLKSHGITAMFTNLIGGPEGYDDTVIGVSSLMDTWIALRDVSKGDFRHRELKLLKSRGMAHSTYTRSFSFTSEGIVFAEF